MVASLLPARLIPPFGCFACHTNGQEKATSKISCAALACPARARPSARLGHMELKTQYIYLFEQRGYVVVSYLCAKTLFIV